MSLALAGGFFIISATWEAHEVYVVGCITGVECMLSLCAPEEGTASNPDILRKMICCQGNKYFCSQDIQKCKKSQSIFSAKGSD